MAKKAFNDTAVRNVCLRSDPKAVQNAAASMRKVRVISRDLHIQGKPEAGRDVTKTKSTGDGPITIKKYANRRLYNTATSSYVTLENLADMVKSGVEFQVYDAKSGDDITKSVLTQIIFEEEAKGENLLPIQFLRQLIGFYDDNMRVFVPSYLEMSMDSFSRNQDDIRARLNDAFDPEATYKNFEDQIRQNLSVFQNTMRMFSPFNAEASGRVADAPDDLGTRAKPSSKDEAATDIDELKSQLAAMQAQLDKLSKD
jgi:polyhydroxyalkanoate synthesis repressor PhaR